jgi:hypothetical protein
VWQRYAFLDLMDGVTMRLSQLWCASGWVHYPTWGQWFADIRTA